MSRWFGNRDPNWDGVRAASLANVPISISPGTVASVGLTAPAQYAVAGSPVTTSGTLALSWVNQNANTVLAGPASGVPAAPTFRTMVGADFASGTGYLGWNGSIFSWNTTVPPSAHNLLSASHGDTTPASAVRGDVVTAQGASPLWTRLAISVPAANVRNVLGVDNGDTESAWKTALDTTNPTTITVGATASPGTSLIFAHRDHTHGSPTAWTATAHNLLSATHGDTTLAGAVRGDIVTAQGASPLWARLAISVPAATYMNYLGVANGDTEPGYKVLFDATVPGTIVAGAAAATGSATVAARRDHTHGAPSTWAATAHNLLSATHGDTAAGSVVDGDVIIGNVTPAWSRLAVSVPAANVRNVFGVDNGETRPSWKTALDATNPVTLTVSTSVAPGTALVFSHRDHAHAITSSSNPGAAASILASTAAGLLTLVNLNLSATSNQLVMQSAGITGTLTWTPTASNKVITLPDVTGTVVLGTGANTWLAYWSATNVLTGSANLTYDGTAVAIRGGVFRAWDTVGATGAVLELRGNATSGDWVALLQPAALTASRSYQLPDVSGIIALGAGTLTVSTANSVAVADHTHAITSSSNPGAAAAILASTAAGLLTLAAVTITGVLTGNRASFTPTLNGTGVSVSRIGTGAGNGEYWTFIIQNATATDVLVFGGSSSTFTTGGVFGWAGNNQFFLYYPNEFRIGTGVGATPVMIFPTSGAVTLYRGLAITSDAVILTAIASDATTNQTPTGITVRHDTSATPAAQFGILILYDLQTTTTVDTLASIDRTVWVDATHATRKARRLWFVYDTAQREALRIEASGSAAMIGFLGAEAVVRQTLGAAATDPATTQTLANNIRTALINLGLGQT